MLDLTRFVAGSQTTALLAAFGADVVKLEVPPGGDPYRVQGTERLGDQSVLFLSLNSGKRSLALDFRSPLAAEAVDRLLASSHFVVENARPGSLARYGLDWETVHERYPSIVYGSISGYGDVGPDAARGGFDLILQAESGVMSVTGSEGSGPVKVGAPVLDVGAGLCCAFGLLAAHIERERTGDRHARVVLAARVRAGRARDARGEHVRLGAGARVCSGRTRRRSRRTAGSAPPTGGSSWRERARRTCGSAAARCSAPSTCVDDPRFADNASRVRHRDELTAALEDVLRREPSAHWLALLGAEGVPAAEVQDIAQVFASEQTRALGAVQELHHATRRRLPRRRGRPCGSTWSRSRTRCRRPRSGSTRSRS